MRINPRELHIKDPHYYDEIYAPASRKREKDPKFVNEFGAPYSMIATVGHDLHRFRRGLLNNFFSKKSVLELSPLIHEKASKLMRRFEESHQADTVLRLDDAFAALTGDLISQYSWGVSSGFLEDEHFKNDIRQALNEMAMLVHLNRYFPILSTILKAMPRWLVRRLRPGATAILDVQDMAAQQSTAQREPIKSSRKTMFDALSDPTLPPKERSLRRLQDEALVVLVAGTETTAKALTLAAFYIYQDRPVLLKVRDELRSVIPTPFTEASWPQLEQLPYLVRRRSPLFKSKASHNFEMTLTRSAKSAVVNESIRLSQGTIFRSTRVAPTESLRYQGLVIPPGVRT